MRSFVAKASVTAVAFLKSCHGFYMPGVRPHEFLPGEEVPMKVNALSSIHTQVSELSDSCCSVVRGLLCCSFFNAHLMNTQKNYNNGI